MLANAGCGWDDEVPCDTDTVTVLGSGAVPRVLLAGGVGAFELALELVSGVVPRLGAVAAPAVVPTFCRCCRVVTPGGSLPPDGGEPWLLVPLAVPAPPCGACCEGVFGREPLFLRDLLLLFAIADGFAAKQQEQPCDC